MKKLLFTSRSFSAGLLFICTALISFTAKPQDIPNPGFENWIVNFDYIEPEGWGTLNLLSTGLFGNPPSVFKDSLTPYAGNYAMNLTTIVLTNNPDTNSLRDTIGVAFTGSVSFSGQSFGFPYTQKPDMLKFYFKYFPVGNDTAFCNVQLFKWNSTTMQRDTLAEGYFWATGTVSIYMQAAAVLEYDAQHLSLTPDTAMISFIPSNDYLPMPGSSMFVDALEFDFNSGVEENSKNNTALAFPNPASTELNLQFSENESATVQLFDVSGKEIAKTFIAKNAAKFDVSQLSNGLYFYKALDKNNKQTTSGKFNIAR